MLLVTPMGRARGRAGWLRLAVFAAGAASTASTHAAEKPEQAGTGFSLRLRTGIGLPAGKVDGEHKLSDTYGVLVPFDLEAGYWVLPRLFVGARGAFGILTVAEEACGAPLECSAYDVRFGAGVEYRFDVGGPFRKWASLGLGWEITRFGISANGGSASRVDSGPEYLRAEFGGDFPLGSELGVGPFIAASLGEYRTATLNQADGSSTTYSIEETEFHEWFLLGVRGVWTP
jgi:hypothetical protein